MTAVPLNSSVILLASANVAPPVLTVTVETPPFSTIVDGSAVTDQTTAVGVAVTSSEYSPAPEALSARSWTV